MVLPTRYPNFDHYAFRGRAVKKSSEESAVSINEKLKMLDRARRQAERDYKDRIYEIERKEREILGLK